MGLRDRLDRASGHNGKSLEQASPAAIAPPRIESTPHRTAIYQNVERLIHQRLIDYIDTHRLSVNDSPEMRQQIRVLLEQMLEQENPPLNKEERHNLLLDVEDETFGLGPLEPLLRDATINDILVNRANEVYIERFGRLERTEVTFRDNAHLMQMIERIVSRVNRRIDESSPMVDARLPDGSRVNAIIPPLAVDGAVLSIRRFYQNPLTMEDFLRFGTLNKTAALLLEAAVKTKLNILVSGGTGSGKTTLLNVLVRFISASERVVSIEDTVELRLQGLHFVRLETRPPNIEGQGEVTQRNLLRNALRMRPDRILIGEVRGDEAYDMMQAMNTGHKGSITTIHANSPRDALARLETMILMAGVNLTSEAIRRQISSALDLVVQLQRFPDGNRRVVSVSEIAGMEEQMIKLQEVFKFDSKKGTPGSTVKGEFVTTGILPAFLEELHQTGNPLSLSLMAQWQTIENTRG